MEEFMGIFRDGIPETTLNITTPTLIKKGPGSLVSFTISVAGAAGTINDAATVGGAAASNVICATPAAAQAVFIPFTFQNGLVVSPGAAQVISVCWQ
jgi:hypothetical protein